MVSALLCPVDIMDNEKGHTALHKAAAYKYVAYSQKMQLNRYIDFNVQQTIDEIIIFSAKYMIIITLGSE